jgi:hypothetical protein
LQRSLAPISNLAGFKLAKYMASDNMQQPLKTEISYCVHNRVLDSHQELLLQERSCIVMPSIGVSSN